MPATENEEKPILHFQCPVIQNNPVGWGPALVPENFSDVPYTPFNKQDKVGKAADWQAPLNFTGANRFGNRFRDRETAGSVQTPFNYFFADDSDEFTLVNSTNFALRPRTFGRKFQNQTRSKRAVPPRRGAATERLQYKGGKGKGGQRNTLGRKQKVQARNRRYTPRWGGGMPWDQKRMLDWAIDINPSWEQLEEIDFSTLKKSINEVPAAADLMWCGKLDYYDDKFDSITVRTEKKLQVNTGDRVFYNVSTTNDPVIRQLANDNVGNVFATDAVLALLMAAPRSVYSWDIVIDRIGNKLFLNQGHGLPLTVNETSHENTYDEKDPTNNPYTLAEEASLVNVNFLVSVVDPRRNRTFENPNPFHNSQAGEGEPASCVYRYRKWALGNGQELVARCEIDSVRQKKNAEEFLHIRALNEFDPKITGIDWRQKLDSQRGAILATELKNNSNKLAKWTAQALLANVDQIVLGYISRADQKSNRNHVILGLQSYKPTEFAQQISLEQRNIWGIVKYLVEKWMNLPEGRYLCIKDPNKPHLLIYKVPSDAFEELEDEEEAEDEEDAEGNPE